jgi:hypothetical protein
VVFFPTLFFGRVVSPLDVLYNDPPWRAVHHPVEVTNPDLERPATAYLPLLEAARRDGASIALWNPYLAGGAPGVLAWNDGLLSPTVLPFLPWIDPALLPNAVILAKLLLAFVGTWLLLRRLGLGQTAASVGGAAFALSGPLTAAWLWPSSATGAALPLLLYAADRVLAAAKPWRTVAAGTLAWLAFLAGGGPGETAVGLVLVAAWVIVRFGEARRRGAAGLRHLAAVAASASIAGALLAPSFGLFAASLGPSGALARPAAHHAFGWQAFRLLVDPFAFGDPRRATYSPPPALSGMAFHDTVLAIGFVTVVLALLGLASRRRGIVFWGAVCGLALAGLAWAPAGVLLPAVPGGRWFRWRGWARYSPSGRRCWPVSAPPPWRRWPRPRAGGRPWPCWRWPSCSSRGSSPDICWRSCRRARRAGRRPREWRPWSGTPPAARSGWRRWGTPCRRTRRRPTAWRTFAPATRPPRRGGSC